MNSRDITSTGTGPTWNGTVLNKSGSSLCWCRKKRSCLFAKEKRLVDNTNLDSRTVICVEPPHASTAGATSPDRATTLGGSLPCTLPHSASSWEGLQSALRLCQTSSCLHTPALGELPPPRGLPAPTLVALAAGPGILNQKSVFSEIIRLLVTKSTISGILSQSWHTQTWKQI